MKEIRCGGCRKLLMKAEPSAITGTIEIKCPRCGTLNSLRPLASPNGRSNKQEPFSDRHERLMKA